jgi:hypothetical protein
VSILSVEKMRGHLRSRTGAVGEVSREDIVDNEVNLAGREPAREWSSNIPAQPSSIIFILAAMKNFSSICPTCNQRVNVTLMIEDGRATTSGMEPNAYLQVMHLRTMSGDFDHVWKSKAGIRRISK